MASSLPQHRAQISSDQRTLLIVCLLLLAAVFVVFGQTLGHGFVNFDDEDYFASNPHVRGGLTWNNFRWAFQIGYAANWHPLTWLSLMLDAQLFGPGPAGPHVTNVVLHASSTLLLFFVLRLLTGMVWPCAFVAIAFAVHPLHVESVAWISERKDVLSGLFFMLTLLCYANYARQDKGQLAKSKSSYCLALLFFTCGLMSKPMLVTVPFILLLLDYWPLGRFSFSGWNTTVHSPRTRTTQQLPPLWLLVAEKLPYFVLSATSCALTIFAQKKAIVPTEILSIVERIANVPVSYTAYLFRLLVPVGLAAFYPHVEHLYLWKSLLALVLIGGATVGTLMLQQRCPYLLFGWLWYLGMLVPVIGLVQVGAQSWADRYTYLPLIGLCIAVTWATLDLASARRIPLLVIRVMGFTVTALWIVCGAIQCAYWRSSESLWNHALACTARNYVAHCDLASVRAKQGRIAEAIEHYRATLELKPDYADANDNLGVLLAGQGKVGQAIEHYRRALEARPGFAAAHINWANALAVTGQSNEAAEHYRQALQLQPDSGEAYNGLGALLLAEGRTAEALANFQKAAEVMPDNADVQNNLGTVFANQGRNSEALKYFLKALELNPNSPKNHYNLANLLVARGELDEGARHYEQALKIAPDFLQARYQLGLVLQSRGDFAAAAAQFQRVLDFDPNRIAAQNNLAWLLATCPDNQVRNGLKSVELAEKAAQLSGGKSPEILDTLAAAYAEAGRFDQACATTEHALELASAKPNSNQIALLRTKLALYRTRSPFRDPGPTNATYNSNPP